MVSDRNLEQDAARLMRSEVKDAFVLAMLAGGMFRCFQSPRKQRRRLSGCRFSIVDCNTAQASVLAPAVRWLC
jgi:hypothetical protein